MIKTLLLSALAVTLTAQASTPAHHLPDGTFTNTDGSQSDKPFSDLMRWRSERGDLPLDEYFSDARIEKTLTALNYQPNTPIPDAPERGAVVTWLGHASFLIQTPNLTLLTDPHLTSRASPFSFAGPKRFGPKPLDVTALPPVDVVVISHNHYDHLDKRTIKALLKSQSSEPRWLVPLGLASWFKGVGADNVREMDWWQIEEVGEADIHFVPVHHWSARTPTNRNKTLWGGWVLKSDDLDYFFAGDTGWSSDFRDIGQRLGPFDLSSLPVGAYEPRWFMKQHHVNPAEAVDIHLAVRSDRSIGMHWGTFQLTDEPYDQPVMDLAAARKAKGVSAEDFFVLPHGASVQVDPP